MIYLPKYKLEHVIVACKLSYIQHFNSNDKNANRENYEESNILFNIQNMSEFIVLFSFFPVHHHVTTSTTCLTRSETLKADSV